MTTPDLTPTLTSRVVTIDVTDPAETAPGTGTVEIALPYDLHIPSAGLIVQARTVTVRLVDGHAEIRLPVYQTTARRVDGSTDWVLVVRKSWSTPYAVRVPAGSSPVALASLLPVRALTPRERAYALTSVGLTVREGTQAAGSASMDDGHLQLDLTVPSFDPAVMYPFIDGQVAEADAALRADLYQRLAFAEAAYTWAREHGYTGTAEEWAAQGIPATWTWAQITQKPTMFPPATHTHPWAEVTGKPTAYTPVQHSHPIADITGLEAKLQVQDSGWTQASLEMGSGWSLPTGNMGHWRPLSYRLRDGWVTVSGWMKKSSAAVKDEALCRLPVGARPSRAAFGLGILNEGGQVLSPEANSSGGVAVYIHAPL